MNATDMTGRTIGGWLVLRRAGSSAVGNARWLVRHCCGAPHEQLIEGRWLRVKPHKYCNGCRPARVGRWGSRYEGASKA